MFKSLATYYLKTRVINHSFQLGRTMTEMTKASLENPDEFFLEEDSMNYYESLFLSHVAPRWKIDESLLGKTELAKYKEGVKKIQEFRELHDLIKNLSGFYWEFRTLYLEVTRETASSNCWSRREWTTNTFQDDISGHVRKYIDLLEKTKDYPEWNEKIKGEVGYYVHLIYNSLCNDSHFQHIFNEFDRHYFFK